MQWTETNGYRRYGTKNARISGATDWSATAGTLSDQNTSLKLLASAGAASMACDAFTLESPSWIHLRLKTGGMDATEYWQFFVSTTMNQSRDYGPWAQRYECKVYADRIEASTASISNAAVTEVGANYVKFNFTGLPNYYKGAYIRVKDGAAAGLSYYVSSHLAGGSPSTMYVRSGNPQADGMLAGDHVDVLWIHWRDTTGMFSLLLALQSTSNTRHCCTLIESSSYLELLRALTQSGSNRIQLTLANAAGGSTAAVYVEGLGVERPRPDGSIAGDTFPDELKLSATSNVSRAEYSVTPATKYAGNPVLTVGGWATRGLDDGSVIEDGDLLRMAFAMYGTIDGLAAYMPGIATSETSTGFEVPDAPALPTTTPLRENLRLSHPLIWKEADGSYLMIATEEDGNSPYKAIPYLATSEDGLNFTLNRDAPLAFVEPDINLGNDQWNPSSIVIDEGVPDKRNWYRVFGQVRGGADWDRRGVLLMRGSSAWCLQVFPWGYHLPVYPEVHNVSVIRRFEDDWIMFHPLASGSHEIVVARGRAAHLWGPMNMTALIDDGGASDWDNSLSLLTGVLARETEREFWIYYTGSNGANTGSIGLATCAIDRLDWMELDAAQATGTLTTIPLSKPIGGWGELRVNVNAAAEGNRLEAAVIDPGTDLEVPGYGLDDCDDVTSNDTNHAVTWSGNDMSGLLGPEYKLRFRLTRADAQDPSPALYAYEARALSQSKPMATDLRAEGLPAPTEVTDPTPGLSWTYSHPEGLPQTGYRVIVCSSLAALEAGDGDVWDSGEVESASHEVAYAGPPLADETAYFWKVRVRSGAGVWSDW